MLSVLIVNAQLTREAELLAMLFEKKIIVSFAQDLTHALDILAEDIHRFHGVIVDRLLSIDTLNDFLKNIHLHYEYITLPVIIFSSEPMSAPGFLTLTDHNDIAHIHQSIEEYKNKKHNGYYNIGLLIKGEFHLKTINEVNSLAKILAAQFPKSEQIVVGIAELLINAVEHGNLGIMFEDKTKLLAENAWHHEIERRLKSSEYAHRKVIVYFERTAKSIKISIRDEGQGFNWHDFDTIDPRRFLASHGRGIMMARSVSFDTVSYNDEGNCVYAEFFLDRER